MWRLSCAQDRATNRKLKMLCGVINHLGGKYPENKDYIEENMKEICEWEHITVEEVVYFVNFV